MISVPCPGLPQPREGLPHGQLFQEGENPDSCGGVSYMHCQVGW